MKRKKTFFQSSSNSSSKENSDKNSGKGKTGKAAISHAENPASKTPEQIIQKRKRESLAKTEASAFFFRLIGLAFFVWIVFFVLFRFIPVEDNDMKPALQIRDLMIVYTQDKAFQAGDTVAYQADNRTKAGRVVAIPGDTIEIKDNSLFINGGMVTSENIYFETPAYESDVEYPLTLEEDEFFILGDNRKSAADSRLYGSIERSSILGKVTAVIRTRSI